MFISSVHSCLLNFKPGTKGWGARFPQHPSGLPVTRYGWIAAHPILYSELSSPVGLCSPHTISCIIQNSLLSCTFDFLADTPSSFPFPSLSPTRPSSAWSNLLWTLPGVLVFDCTLPRVYNKLCLPQCLGAVLSCPFYFFFNQCYHLNEI